jgi:hypothetical protein
MAASMLLRSDRVPWPRKVVSGTAESPFTHTVLPAGMRTHRRANPYPSPPDACTTAANACHVFAAAVANSAVAYTSRESPLSSVTPTGTPAAADCR